MFRKRSLSSIAYVTFGLCLVPALASAQDLTAEITKITVNPNNNNATYQVRVCNTANAGAAAASKVGLYFDRATEPSCSDTPDEEVNVGSLAAGKCSAVYTFDQSSLARGTYKAWARSDWDCKVTEEKENNNSVSQIYLVLPDFQVQVFTATTSGTDVTFNVTVKNYGVSTPGTFYLGLYFDSATEPTCAQQPNQSWQIDGLNANASKSFSFTRTNVGTGGYKAWAFVDYSCGQGETTDFNNTKSAMYGIGSNLWVAPEILVGVNNSTVVYNVAVCNLGTEATGVFDLSLWYAKAAAPECSTGSASYTWSVGSLPSPLVDPSNNCTLLTHTRVNAPPGAYNAYVFADPTCALAETDETDNIRSKVYVVPVADYYVSSFTSTTAGSDVTFDGQICNQGATTTVGSKVGLFYVSASAPGCASTPSFTWNIPGLALGECFDLPSHTRTNVPQGGAIGWLMADQGCVLSENDETNNRDFLTYSVAPTVPALFVSSLSAVVVDDQVTFTAKYCNSGTAVATDIPVGFYHNSATAPTCATPANHEETLAGGLAGGACKNVTYVTNIATVGSYVGWTMVDRDCSTAENFESDNVRSVDYDIVPSQAPDLQVDTFDVTVDSSKVTLSAKICNKGNVVAAASKLGFFFSRPNAPSSDCLDGADATVNTPPLAINSCYTMTHERANATQGDYTAWAMADSACGITESDESNNNKSKTYKVEPPPVPDAAVVSDAGPSKDGAVKSDSTVSSDSSSPKNDGGVVTADGSVPGGDGGVSGDKGTSVGDGGTGDLGGDAAGSSSGCGCQVNDPGATPLLGLLLGLGLWLQRRQRRNRRRSSSN